MSGGGEAGRGRLPAEWARLERSVEDVAASLGGWKRRLREAEEEVERLRRTLEQMEAASASADLAAELARLRAENAALKGRMQQARKRVAGLMQRLSALELEP